MSALVIFKARK